MRTLITDPNQSLLYASALDLIALIKTSYSSYYREGKIADLIQSFLKQRLIRSNRDKNTVWSNSLYFDTNKPSILLYTHIGIIKSGNESDARYSAPDIQYDKRYHHENNDTQAAAVCLISAFIHFYNHPNLPFNLCLSITDEQQDSHDRRVTPPLPDFGRFEYAIIGQPTGMHLATVEKGTLTLTCTSKPAADTEFQDEEENAIYLALQDIMWFSSYQFPKISHSLGSIKMNVTEIEGSRTNTYTTSHCQFTVNVRLTDAYAPKDILSIIRKHVRCEISLTHIDQRYASISHQHPLVLAGLSIGRSAYTSSVTNFATLNIPSLYMGPGKPVLSGPPDELIYRKEIHEGILLYIKYLEALCPYMANNMDIYDQNQA